MRMARIRGGGSLKADVLSCCLFVSLLRAPRPDCWVNKSSGTAKPKGWFVFFSLYFSVRICETVQHSWALWSVLCNARKIGMTRGLFRDSLKIMKVLFKPELFSSHLLSFCCNWRFVLQHWQSVVLSSERKCSLNTKYDFNPRHYVKTPSKLKCGVPIW